MRKLTVVILIVTVLVSGSVRADIWELEPTDTAKTTDEINTSLNSEYKSPSTATGLSLAGFLAPVGLFALAASQDGGSSGGGLAILGMVGTIIGPGLGHVYAGETGRFWKGNTLRLVSWGVLLTAVAISWNDTDNSGGVFLAIGAIGLYAGSAIHDIATAGSSVKLYNDKVDARKILVGPILVPQEKAVGIQFAIGF